MSSTAFFNDRGCHIRIERVMSYLANAHALTLACYPYGREREGIRTIRPDTGFMKKDIIGFSFEKIVYDLLLLAFIYRHVQRSKYDLLLAFTYEAGILAMILRALTGIPYILDYQGSLYEELTVQKPWMALRPLGAFIKYVERMVNRKAGCIIFNTQFSYNNSQTACRMLIDDEMYPQRQMQVASFRMKEEKIVLWMGILNKAQGFDAMERVMTEILESDADVRFVIIGFPTTESVMNKFGIYNDRVIFTGRVPYESIPSLLRDADVCISTKSQSTEGSSKLHLYKRFCRHTLALKSNAASELLNEEQICRNERQLTERLKEIVKV